MLMLNVEKINLLGKIYFYLRHQFLNTLTCFINYFYT